MDTTVIAQLAMESLTSAPPATVRAPAPADEVTATRFAEMMKPALPPDDPAPAAGATEPVGGEAAREGAEEGDQEDHRQDHRVVAGEGAGDEEAPEARNAEDRLDEDRAGQQDTDDTGSDALRL